jgi:NADH-quinone oxidoreductase subunit K
MITYAHYSILSAILLTLSLFGLCYNRSNVIGLLLCIELMLLAVTTNFIALSYHFQQLDGQIYVFFILAVAAAETAIGLAILLVTYRQYNTANIAQLNQLKG